MTDRSISMAVRRDRWTCPWTTTTWLVFGAAVTGTVAALLLVTLVLAIAVGRGAALVVGGAGLAVVALLALVGGAVVAEDRAGAEPVRLTRARRDARRAHDRLASTVRRVPDGMLRHLVADETAAVGRQLDAYEERLEQLWLDQRATTRLAREAARAGSSVTASVAALRDTRRGDETRRAEELTNRLDALANATERLRVAVTERAALDRVTHDAPPAPLATSALPPPEAHPDAVTAALEELAALDRATLDLAAGGRSEA